MLQGRSDDNVFCEIKAEKRLTTMDCLANVTFLAGGRRYLDFTSQSDCSANVTFLAGGRRYLDFTSQSDKLFC